MVDYSNPDKYPSSSKDIQLRDATFEEVKAKIYELYPYFEPTANTILLAIDNLRCQHD